VWKNAALSDVKRALGVKFLSLLRKVQFFVFAESVCDVIYAGQIPLSHAGGWSDNV
jgi:hypothetical protein